MSKSIEKKVLQKSGKTQIYNLTFKESKFANSKKNEDFKYDPTINKKSEEESSSHLYQIIKKKARIIKASSKQETCIDNTNAKLYDQFKQQKSLNSKMVIQNYNPQMNNKVLWKDEQNNIPDKKNSKPSLTSVAENNMNDNIVEIFENKFENKNLKKAKTDKEIQKKKYSKKYKSLKSRFNQKKISLDMDIEIQNNQADVNNKQINQSDENKIQEIDDEEVIKEIKDKNIIQIKKDSSNEIGKLINEVVNEDSSMKSYHKNINIINLEKSNSDLSKSSSIKKKKIKNKETLTPNKFSSSDSQHLKVSSVRSMGSFESSSCSVNNSEDEENIYNKKILKLSVSFLIFRILIFQININ